MFATEAVNRRKQAAVALATGPSAARPGHTVHGVPGLPVMTPRTVNGLSYEGAHALGATPDQIRAAYAAEKQKDPASGLYSALAATVDAKPGAAAPARKVPAGQSLLSPKGEMHLSRAPLAAAVNRPRGAA